MRLKTLRFCSAIFRTAFTGPAAAGHAAGQPGDIPPGRQFVGTCYQPADRSPEEIRNEIALMKKAPADRVEVLQ